MKRDHKDPECGSCNSQERWLLHNVRHRGIYMRLCTSCVLKLHPGLFCPSCFEVYEDCNPPINRVICLKCPSVCHLTCVSKEIASRYNCPTCSDPRHVFFESNKKINRDCGGSGGGDLIPNGNNQVINLNSAKVLVAAARLASISMNKAASVARMEAEKRAKEAALTRKRAKEAMERVALIASGKEIENNSKEMMGMEIVSTPVEAARKKKKPKTSNAFTAAVEAQKRFQNQVGMAVTDANDQDKSGKNPFVQDNVLSRKTVNSPSFGASNSVQKLPANGVMGRPQVPNTAIVNGSERASNFFRPQNNVNLQREKEKSGGVSVVNGVEQNIRKSKEFRDSGTVPQLTHSNEVMKEFYYSRDLQNQQDNGL